MVICGGGYVRRLVCGGGVDVVVCLLSPFQSSLQSSRHGPSVTAGPHSIPHYKQGKVHIEGNRLVLLVLKTMLKCVYLA